VDPTLIILVALVAVMAIFMFRNSRKRQADAQQLQERLVPGVEVMTTQGIYGVLISLDHEKNEAVIETTPGTRLRLHSQTVSRVVEPEVEESSVDADELDSEEPDAKRDSTD
jgi:preprotein translocase subunit YajC